MSGHSNVTRAVADIPQPMVLFACASSTLLQERANNYCYANIRAFSKSQMVSSLLSKFHILTLQIKYLYLWKTLTLTRPYTSKL